MNLYIYRYLETNEFTFDIWKNIVIDKEKELIINRASYNKDKIHYRFKECRRIGNLNKINLIKRCNVRIIYAEYISLKPINDIS